MRTSLKFRRYFLLPLLATLSGCISSPSQFMMDREVARLCELDGGVHVYEQVPLSKENFGPRGEVFPQYENSPPGQELGPEYTTDGELSVKTGDSPRLWQHRERVIRKADNKLLGEWIGYHRAGGGIWGYMEGNAFSCLQISSKYKNDLISKVFTVKREE